MREPIKYRLTWLLIVTILAIVFGMLCTSCASSKSKHSEYQKTDSTHKEQEQTTTKVKVDSVATHESTSEEENSVVIDFGDSQMVVVPKSEKDSGIYFDPNNTANDYFYWDGTTLISSKVPQKITIKGNIKKTEKDSVVKNMEALQDHSQIKEDHVITTVKVTDKQKKGFSIFQMALMGWGLIILLWILIYIWRRIKKQRDFVWRWVIKVCTGV